MIDAGLFVEVLKKRKHRFFTGVPCSFFQSAINRVADDADLRYVTVPNEGSALAAASGASLAGSKPVVMIQNSGLGNLINPLTSLNMIYRIPCLLFVSGRAYGVADEPQHEIIGKTMGSMLSAIGVRHADMPPDAEGFSRALDEASRYMENEKQPFVFFVRKGTIGDFLNPRDEVGPYPMKRLEAIRAIAETFEGDEYVVATTGKPSRELFATNDRKKNFYMQGSMGHAAAIGLGLALERPRSKIIVLDGDGAILMHLGILSSIGHYKPKNLYHIVLDNEAYESTGDQDTTSPNTDLARIALSSGYAFSRDASDLEGLRDALARMTAAPGPGFLRVKINRLPTENIPRISEKYSSEEIARHFSGEFPAR